jgi:hypothetical protein
VKCFASNTSKPGYVVELLAKEIPAGKNHYDKGKEKGLSPF